MKIKNAILDFHGSEITKTTARFSDGGCLQKGISNFRLILVIYRNVNYCLLPVKSECRGVMQA